MSHWLVLISILLANDVEKNPGPLRSPEKRKSKLRRNKSVVRDSGVSSAGSASPTMLEEARKEEEEEEEKIPSPDTITTTPQPPPAAVVETDKELEEDKMKVLQSEISSLQTQLTNVDQNVEKLLSSIETLRPLYNQAREALSSLGSHQQKNSLVFHGIKPDKLEKDMAAEPDFCRDILETRIKGILKEHLKISRDISFLQVKRIDSAPEVTGAKPCIVSFAAWKDKENVLRQAKLLKGCGIYITEDVSHKNGKSKLRRSSSVAPAGKLTGRDSENKLEVKASILESEYTSSASGTD